MEIYLIKLFLAHFIGDFFLQPKHWVVDKESKKIKSTKLYMHTLVHIGLIFIVFFSFDVWKVALLVGLIHWLIDVLKLEFQNPQNTRILFFVDQLFHGLSLIVIWLIFYNGHLNWQFFQSINVWLICLAALFLTMPAAIIMRMIMTKWIPQALLGNSQSLQNAGMYIGILERLLILLFVLTQHFEAVGFLLAAKSIFRFGDLKEAHDIKLTEYVLIGTLLSFGLAIGIGFLAIAVITP